MAVKKIFKPADKGELCELCDNLMISLALIDTSLITDMSNLFFETLREDFTGIESWEISQVTDMRWMFLGSGFKGDLSGWELNDLCKTRHMFDRDFPVEKRPKQKTSPENGVKYPKHLRKI